jgi:hypothetical protein
LQSQARLAVLHEIFDVSAVATSVLTRHANHITIARRM